VGVGPGAGDGFGTDGAEGAVDHEVEVAVGEG
jgi:hypothetical protein